LNLLEIKNTDLLLQKAQKEPLYPKLLTQLEKDFRRANQYISLKNLSPIELKTELKKTIADLFENDFYKYLTLLYIIDVSESQIKSIVPSNLNEYFEQITFLVFRREWLKVHIKNQQIP